MQGTPLLLTILGPIFGLALLLTVLLVIIGIGSCEPESSGQDGDDVSDGDFDSSHPNATACDLLKADIGQPEITRRGGTLGFFIKTQAERVLLDYSFNGQATLHDSNQSISMKLSAPSYQGGGIAFSWDAAPYILNHIEFTSLHISLVKRDNPSDVCYEWIVHGLPVDTRWETQTPLISTRLDIDRPAPRPGMYPKVLATGDTTLLAAWRSYDSGRALPFVTRLETWRAAFTTGVFLRTDPYVSMESALQLVALDEGQTLICWSGRSDTGQTAIVAARLNTEGEPVMGPQILLAFDDPTISISDVTSIAADTGIWLAWVDDSNGSARVGLQRFNRSLDSTTEILRPSRDLPRYATEGSPTLLFTENDTLHLAWRQNNQDCALLHKRFSASSGAALSDSGLIDIYTPEPPEPGYPDSCFTTVSLMYSPQAERKARLDGDSGESFDGDLDDDTDILLDPDSQLDGDADADPEAEVELDAEQETVIERPDFFGIAAAFVSTDPARPGVLLSYLQQDGSFSEPFSIAHNDSAARGQLTIKPDDNGGHVLAWIDGRIDNIYDIYVQRIDAAGIPLAEPLAITTDIEPRRMSYQPKVAVFEDSIRVMWYAVDSEQSQDLVMERVYTAHGFHPSRIVAKIARGYANSGFALDTAGAFTFSLIQLSVNNTIQLQPFLAGNTEHLADYDLPVSGFSDLPNDHASLHAMAANGNERAVVFSTRSGDGAHGEVVQTSVGRWLPPEFLQTTADSPRRMRIAAIPGVEHSWQITRERPLADGRVMLESAYLNGSALPKNWTTLNPDDVAQLGTRQHSLIAQNTGDEATRLAAFWLDIRAGVVGLYTRRQTARDEWGEEICLTATNDAGGIVWSLDNWAVGVNGVLWTGSTGDFVTLYYTPAPGQNATQPDLLLGRLEGRDPDIALGESATTSLAIFSIPYNPAEASSQLYIQRLAATEETLSAASLLDETATQFRYPNLIPGANGLWLATVWRIDEVNELMDLLVYRSVDDGASWGKPVTLLSDLSQSLPYGLVSGCAFSTGLVLAVSRIDWPTRGMQLFTLPQQATLAEFSAGFLPLGEDGPPIDGFLLDCRPDGHLGLTAEVTIDGIDQLHHFVY